MRQHYPLNANGAEDAGKLPWTDGVPQTGTEGSYPGHALFTDTEAEILATIDASGQTRNGSDLTQLVQAFARGIYLGQFAGTANALAAAIPNSIVFATLLRGMRFTGFVTATNTAGVTVALTCLGGGSPTVTAPLLRKNGTALQSGDLPVAQDFEIRWDGSAFRMVGAVASDGGSLAGIAPLLPLAFQAHGIPQTLIDQANVQITGFSTIDFNTFTTSTLTAGTFTCGAGEGGAYEFDFSLKLQTSPGLSHNIALFITKNDGQSSTVIYVPPGQPGSIAGNHGAISGQNDVADNSVSGANILAPGDVIKFWAYNSTIGVTQGAAYGKPTTDFSSNVSIRRGAR